MLTAERRTPVAKGAVRLDVGSTVVRLALVHVAEAEGWFECIHTGRCACLSVSDRLVADRRDVLVVRDVPAACRDAIDLVVRGRARSVVLWNEPEALVTVFDAVRTGSTVIPDKVIELAANAPLLTGRQRDTLRLAATGRANRLIAVALHQSISTVKRDITELLELFDVPNRTALMSVAGSLGYLDPHPILNNWSHPTRSSSAAL